VLKTPNRPRLKAPQPSEERCQGLVTAMALAEPLSCCGPRAAPASRHAGSLRSAPLARAEMCFFFFPHAQPLAALDLERKRTFFQVDTFALNKWRSGCQVLTYFVQTGSNKIFELPVEFPSFFPPFSTALYLARARLGRAAEPSCIPSCLQKDPQEAEHGKMNSWKLYRGVSSVPG